MLSMGQLIEPGKAIAWRGPMTAGALGQLVDADWGVTDTLVVDLPPGTGDVQLTMVQKHRPAGAVIVSTPQDLALIDAAATERPGRDPVSAAAARARVLGIDLAVHGSPEWLEQVSEDALDLAGAAVSEALLNVSKHAGVAKAVKPPSDTPPDDGGSPDFTGLRALLAEDIAI